MFLCPCCGDPFVVPLASCEWLLDDLRRAGWREPVVPALCHGCQPVLAAGAAVTVRGGQGLAADGSCHDLVPGSAATVEAALGGVGEADIFRVRLASGGVVYVARARLRPQGALP